MNVAIRAINPWAGRNGNDGSILSNSGDRNVQNGNFGTCQNSNDGNIQNGNDGTREMTAISKMETMEMVKTETMAIM